MCKTEDKYGGRVPSKWGKAKTASLYWIRNSKGSQWSSVRMDVIYLCFLFLAMRRAEQFWTLWRRFIWSEVIPVKVELQKIKTRGNNINCYICLSPPLNIQVVEMLVVCMYGEGDKFNYITHKNIPLILLVNTTSRDLKYYAYIPDIWREGKKVTIKKWIYPSFWGI